MACGNLTRTASALVTWMTVGAGSAVAQVTMQPSAVAPGATERFAVHVVNPLDSPFVAIRLEVPADIEILGVRPWPEWPFTLEPSADGGELIEWRGGWVASGELQEFVFLGRLRTDVDGDAVAFPVHLTRVGGAVESWVGSGANPAPRVLVDRIPELTTEGTTMLGMVAIVVSFAALALAIAARFRRNAAT